MDFISTLTIDIFADGADKKNMIAMYQKPFIKGFTTNPTLMRQAGIVNYEAFAKDILSVIKDKPISFEVFSDDFDEMYQQAKFISSWAPNVYVKIPVSNTKGEPAFKLIQKLAEAGVKQNVTAIMTLDQVYDVSLSLSQGPSAYISVFAGRVADTGRDPVLLMQRSLDMMCPYSHLKLIWASPRELYNIFQANEMGCHVITVTQDILKKINIIGKDLHEYSLETVKMFYDDAVKAGFSLEKFINVM